MKKLEVKGTSVEVAEVRKAIVETAYVRLGKKMMVCHLTLANGHEVVGVSAIVDPEKFDVVIGRKIAYDNAVNEVWKHMGSILQDRLAND
jgi:hypothetical protein